MENITGTPSPMDDKPKKKRSGLQKVLIGCGIGCGAIVVLILIGVGVLGWWFISTGEQVATGRILAADSIGAIRLENVAENKDAMDLASSAIKEIQQRNNQKSSGQIPPFFESLRNYSQSNQDLTPVLKMFFPKEATVSITSDESGEIRYVVAANFSAGTRLIQKILHASFSNEGSPEKRIISTPYGDLFPIDLSNRKAGDKEEWGAIGFYKGTLLLGNETKTTVSAMSRLAQGKDNGELNHALSESFNRLRQKGWIAYGVLDGSVIMNTSQDMAALPDNLKKDVEKVEMAANILPNDEAVYDVHLYWRNEKAAKMALNNVADYKAKWIQDAERAQLFLKVQNSLSGNQQSIEFLFGNLKNAMASKIKNLH
jgi:hypothetical protein